MPAYLSHAIFSDVTLQKLKIQNKCPLPIPSERIRLDGIATDLVNYNSHLAYYNHNHYVHRLVMNMVEYIIAHQLQEDVNVISYLYGHIMHCILDQEIHPYIYYSTDNSIDFNINGQHFQKESLLDTYLAHKILKNLPQEKITSYCFEQKGFSKETKEFMNVCYQNTYGVKNISIGCIWAKRALMFQDRIFRFDRTGNKRKLYESWNLKYLSHQISPKEYEDATLWNFEHQVWINPNDPHKIKKTDSIDDLWETALTRSLETLDKVNSCLYQGYLDREFKLMFPDRSLDTGISCNYHKQYY